MCVLSNWHPAGEPQALRELGLEVEHLSELLEKVRHHKYLGVTLEDDIHSRNMSSR